MQAMQNFLSADTNGAGWIDLLDRSGNLAVDALMGVNRIVVADLFGKKLSGSWSEK